MGDPVQSLSKTVHPEVAGPKLQQNHVIHIVVPPLRERREDIVPLVNHFVGRMTRNNGCKLRAIAPETMEALRKYSWPGNVRELENVIERLVVAGRSEVATLGDLPLEITDGASTVSRPRKERRRTIARTLYKRLVDDRESFWSAVYPLYMTREINKSNVREIVRMGLEESRGNYKIVLRLFNMPAGDYKRFLNFLRKHECQLPFMEYRH